jgi:arginine N-succinyltransferase
MTDLHIGDIDRYLMRPATAADIDALERFAVASAYGITTLPADRAALLDRLARSARAFADEDASSGEEIYLFVLEDLASGRIVGTSGIASSAGSGRHFYSYRNEYVVHSSPEPGGQMRVHTLNLCQDLTGATLLTSFYIEPAYEHTLAPQLLSRGRLLFIAQFPERFAERIAAESPGLADDTGYCPFWESVGQRFFGMAYPEVERLAVGRTKAFIGQLLPQSPLYVALLPQAAQWSIGQLHPVSELPFAILQDEGFDADTYVDIFDAGPIVDAKVATLRTVASSRLARTRAARADRPDPDGAPATMHLVASTRRDTFRAVLALAAENSSEIAPDVARRLANAPLTWSRIAPLLSPDTSLGAFDE